MKKISRYDVVNCIICRKPAKHFSGHLHLPKEISVIFTAGFCEEHSHAEDMIIAERIGCPFHGKGCYGNWKTWMGKQSLLRDYMRERMRSNDLGFVEQERIFQSRANYSFKYKGIDETFGSVTNYRE